MKTLSSKQWFYSVLALVVLAITSVLLLNYKIDPLLQFRFDPENPPYVKGKNRHRNPGIIKHVDYDTVIMGTSMAKNSRPQDAEALLGGKAINLAMSGSSAWEQATYLEQALETGKVSTVIMCYDIFMFSGAHDRGKNNFEPYLYAAEPGISDRLRYLLNSHTTERSVKTLSRRGKSKQQKYFDIKNSTYTAGHYQYNRDRILTAWRSERGYNFSGPDFSLEKLQASFEHNFRPLFEQYPAIRFRIFYPPYSILAWVDLVNNGGLETTMAFKSWLSEQTLRYPQVELYDFQDLASITHNLDNYTDLLHHSPAISRQVLQAIRDKQHLVTSTGLASRNIRQQLGRLELESFTR